MQAWKDNILPCCGPPRNPQVRPTRRWLDQGLCCIGMPLEQLHQQGARQELALIWDLPWLTVFISASLIQWSQPSDKKKILETDFPLSQFLWLHWSFRKIWMSCSSRWMLKVGRDLHKSVLKSLLQSVDLCLAAHLWRSHEQSPPNPLQLIGQFGTLLLYSESTVRMRGFLWPFPPRILSLFSSS